MGGVIVEADMEQRRTYHPGTPSWVDHGSPDPAGAADFYQALFGWEAVSQGPADQTGGYVMLQLDGKDVAGLGPGESPSWTMYVSVDDADDIAKAIEANGGSIVMAPMTILDAGRMVVSTDPEGAPFAIWQPGRHTGADIVNEPGTYCWSELACRDVDRAKAFYRAVFGWEGETTMFAEGTSTYTEFRLPDGERSLAGMVQMNEQWPDDIPAHWMTYFAVEDADAVARRAAELGGTVSIEPFDLPDRGRIAVLNDPPGAVFSVIQLAAV